METVIDLAEILHRYAVLLARLSARAYPLAVSVKIDTPDPSRVDAQDGKTIKQCGLIITEKDSWNGDLTAIVRVRDLGLDEDHTRPLSPLLDSSSDVVDLLGDAVVMSHLADFEEFSTHIAPLAWERACTSYIHRHYGLAWVSSDEGELPGMEFQFHASVVFKAVNVKLKRAAEDGAKG
jgi:hypothetical protein